MSHRHDNPRAAMAPAQYIQLVNKPLSSRTGLGRYADELERGFHTAGVDIHQADLRTPLPGAIIRLGRRAGYDLETFSHSYPLRADVRPGYLTYLTSQTLATLLVTQRLPRPVVVMVHDILPYLLRDDPALRIYRHRAGQIADAVAMRGLRRADRLVTNSHYTKQTILDTLGIPDERIAVVHLGVDTERFRPLPVPDEFRQRYGLPDDQRYVLAVGSEDPRKNIATLLRSVALVRQGRSDVTLLKVGAPTFVDQRQRHRQLCQELGIETHVRWFDEVPDEDLPLFYNVADVFAFPSHYEGFGFPVLEALACGTPVVAAHKASIPELADGVAKLVEEPSPEPLAEAIVSTLDRRPDPAPLVAHAGQFTWARTVEQTLAVCNQTLAESRSRR